MREVGAIHCETNETAVCVEEGKKRALEVHLGLVRRLRLELRAQIHRLELHASALGAVLFDARVNLFQCAREPHLLGLALGGLLQSQRLLGRAQVGGVLLHLRLEREHGALVDVGQRRHLEGTDKGVERRGARHTATHTRLLGV